MDQHVSHIITSDLAPAATAGGLAVAVYAAGRTQFFNYGLADEATQRPVTSDSLFNVASVRKPFEATLVALGSQRGELHLNDPIRKYAPELRSDYLHHVTIGQLATHTSGLLLPTDHPPWPNTTFSLDQFFETLNAWTPQSGEEPGRQRIYTHAGYVLLQVLLERRYGRPIAELIESKILRPLDMNDTYVPERGLDNRALLPAETLARAVQGYSDGGMAIGPTGNQQSYYDFPGTGQMLSSARDLCRFIVASLDGNRTDRPLSLAMQMTQRETFRVNEMYGQALAWETVHLHAEVVTDKPGGLNNASAYIGMVPERKIGLVLLANRGNFPHEIARHQVLPELARYYGAVN